MTPINEEIVRLEIELPSEAHDALVRLQQLCGHETLEETILAALKLQGVIAEDGILRLKRKNETEEI